DIAYDSGWRAHYAVDGAEAEALITPGSVLDVHRAVDGVHLCPLGAPEAQLALARAVRARWPDALLSATTFRNRISEQPATARALWGTVDVLVCNAEEALLLTRTGTPAQALEGIHGVVAAGRGGRAVCVTDGGNGAHLVTGQGVPHVAAFPARVVDPTGAGEAFAGAAMAAHLAGAGLLPAMATGAAVASIAVEGVGPERLLAATPPDVRCRAAAITLAGAGETRRG
ncbi:hypothetical protein D7231_36030, partial [Streptomyces klenkii]